VDAIQFQQAFGLILASEAGRVIQELNKIINYIASYICQNFLMNIIYLLPGKVRDSIFWEKGPLSSPSII
jgi:hypothetical protein